jgi:hypothetical protein
MLSAGRPVVAVSPPRSHALSDFMAICRHAIVGNGVQNTCGQFMHSEVQVNGTEPN